MGRLATPSDLQPGGSDRELFPGEHITYDTPHGAGGFALLDDGEYIQTERHRRTVTVMWSTEDTAAQFIDDAGPRSYEDQPGQAKVTLRGGDTVQVPLPDLASFAAEHDISVVRWTDGELELGWRAAVVKRAETPPRSECMLSTKSLSPAVVRSLLNATGSPHVAKAGAETLEQLDVIPA